MLKILEKSPKWLINLILLSFLAFIMILILLIIKSFFFSENNIYIYDKKFGVSSPTSEKSSIILLNRKNIAHSDCIESSEQGLGKLGLKIERSDIGVVGKNADTKVEINCPHLKEYNTIYVKTTSSSKLKALSLNIQIKENITKIINKFNNHKEDYPYWRWRIYDIDERYTKKQCQELSEKILKDHSVKNIENKNLITEGKKNGKIYQILCHQSTLLTNIFSKEPIKSEEENKLKSITNRIKEEEVEKNAKNELVSPLVLTTRSIRINSNSRSNLR